MTRTLATFRLLAALALLTLLPLANQAQAQSGEISAAERAEIEQIVRDYILANPEIIPEAIEVWQQRQQAARDDNARTVLAEQREKVENDGVSLVLGNPQGDVTIVEFFDYRCPYCVRAHTDMDRLINEDPGVRLVLKQYPVKDKPGEEPVSLTAAQVVTAVTKMNPLLAGVLHNKLFEAQGSFTIQDLQNIAGSIGVDMDQLNAELAKPWIIDSLRDNFYLAQSLGVDGTPAIFIGETIMRGHMGYDAIKAAVEETRAKAAD